MHRDPVRLDIVAMIRATDTAADYAQHYLDRADALRLDANKDARERKGECPCCFYLEGRAGGAAITFQPCALCGVEMSFGSTCTDALCLDCADKHSLCRHCGGDRAMRVKRRKWPKKEVADAP